MKLRKTKKGFTVVELVIVIAVIAVLAAILIPTFISLDSRAKKASDQSLVSNLNTALAAQEGEADDTHNDTMHDAVLDLKKWGYDVDALVTKSGEDLLWNSKDNRFLLSKEVASAKTKTGAEDVDFWRIQKSYSTSDAYSVYASAEFAVAPIEVKVGFDVGERTDINDITYSGTATVKIRTNGGTLTVNAPSASVYHYGNLDTLNITAVDTNSYHETGAVVNVANLTAGRLVVEAGGYIKEVAATGGTVVVDGYVNTVTGATATGNGYVPNNNGGTLGNASAVETTIKTVADLHKFRDRVNGGQSYAGLTVKLANDLDLSGVAWAPIGNKANPFVGTFDGQSNTIKGLTNAGYEMSATEIESSTWSGNLGGSYGLFGVIGGTESTTIKDLTLDKVDINISKAKNIGALYGADAKAANSSNPNVGGTIEIKNISVNGTIKSTDFSGATLGGIGGKIYNPGRANVVNCVNSANIIATDGQLGDVKAAGIIGFISDGANTTVLDSCKNYGNISAATTVTGDGKGIFAAGVANKGSGMVYFKSCSTQGEFDLQANNVFFSVIGRGQNARNEKVDTESFEGTTYDVYDDNYPATSLRAYNCSISTESQYKAFKATIKEGEASRTINASYTGLDLFKLYNNTTNN